ncbi:threonine ammonia-lyase, biosynthetic [Candidatus Sumerlaeota bacterium]|nr:threonine ammonia-lyase, biosynthetic [Candidatus Sumerlaeota bacterium]
MTEALFQEILMARRRVYAAFEPTPLQRLQTAAIEGEVFVKREDLSPIHSYKWRGAFNRMSVLTDEERERGVVAASAGNHAQGVAVAASKMHVRAKIYMPVSTPRMKQLAVRQCGGEWVEVALRGDDYNASCEEASCVCREQGLTFIHPYDDLLTMGGQGTLADEIVMSGQGPFDTAYLQIGGGGMAASVACWLKRYYPGIRIIGVEGEEQASMKAAIEAGKVVELPHVDLFSDGTAVKKAGELTYPLCRDLLDDIITVSNEELCAAIQLCWEAQRCIPEPAGAMGLAGLLQQKDQARGKRTVCVICGSNMDFGQFSWIARHAGIGAAMRRFYRFEISEAKGSMLRLFEAFGGANIIEMQYGKTHNERAWPVIGLEASPEEMHLILQRCETLQIPHEDVTAEEDVEFRIINYEPALMKAPYFFKVEFPERAGALRDFMRKVQGLASLCYFNYVYSGERIGRALLAFEFDSEELRAQFQHALRNCGLVYYEIQERALRRML